MYKRQTGPKIVKRRVTIHIPNDGEGSSGFTKASMFLIFEVQPNSVNQEYMEKFNAGDPDTDWLNGVVKGWDGYMEDDGKTPIEFSAEELKLFLDVPYQRIAAVQEYLNVANGGAGKRKN